MREQETCRCYTCVGDKPAYPGSWLTVGMTRMIVCSICGNKRCPHANDHRNVCTGSNELGQQGSAYPASPPPVTRPAAEQTRADALKAMRQAVAGVRTQAAAATETTDPNGESA